MFVSLWLFISVILKNRIPQEITDKSESYRHIVYIVLDSPIFSLIGDIKVSTLITRRWVGGIVNR